MRGVKYVELFRFQQGEWLVVILNGKSRHADQKICELLATPGDCQGFFLYLSVSLLCAGK